MKTRKGMTLIEIVVAIALLGIISVGFISVFSSQLSNIVVGSDITVDAFDNQGIFEELIFTAKSKIQNSEPLSTMPEWSTETVEVLGMDVTLQKLNYENPNRNNRETSVYLSSSLANVDIHNSLSVANVSIEVSNDPLNLIADLTTTPSLTANYDDNSTQTAFYANLFRWWRSEPGMDPGTLVFPDDFALVPVSQSTEELDNLLDNVGANSYVVLTVTPVDIHGYRGTTVRSSNMVYVKGGEWRIGAFPWIDVDNNYDFDGTDHQLVKESVVRTLDARNPYPDPAEPSDFLDLSDGSLFVPMGIEPAATQEPGNEAVAVSGTQLIEWLVERNINLAKDFTVENGSDIVLTSGLGPNGGSVLLHPYVKLDSDGNPIVTGGVVELLSTGVSLQTDGDIDIETAGRGSIYFYGNADLSGENITLRARGVVGITNASIDSNTQMTIDNTMDPSILGSRRIVLTETDFNSATSDTSILFNSPEDVVFKGGSWSANQILTIPNGRRIIFDKASARVNNLGILNLGNTGEVRFVTSMIEDISNQMRLRIIKESDDEMLIVPHNYMRNVGYADAENNVVHTNQGVWRNVGRNQTNMEFSVTILSGEGHVDDIKYNFDGLDTLQILPNSTDETALTKVRLEFRDKYSQNQIKGIGIFNYSTDASGNTTIEVEEEIPVDTYLITFNSNGGTAVSQMEKAYGDPITPPPNPSRPGYTFDGWTPALPAYMPNAHLNVTAIWSPNVYTVTLDAQGGTPNEQTKSVTFGQTYGSLDTPLYSGYTFLGWYTMPNGAGTKVESTDVYSTVGDQILYAHWTAAQLVVSFDSNGGSAPSPASKDIIFGETYGTLPTVTRTNHTFLGWYTSPTAGSLVSDSTIVTLSTNHTLYARWNQNAVPVLVRFNAGSGDVSPENKTVYVGQPYGTLPVPTRSRYEFTGWFFGGDEITSSTIVSQNTNHTLVADWERSSCPFVYSYNGKEYIFEHESIPFAISKALETTSYGTLRHMESSDGKYHIKITEEMDEKSFTNAFKLTAVDYPKNAGIIDVMTDIYGMPHTIKEKMLPVTFIDQDGVDWTQNIHSPSLSVSSSLDLYERGINVATYEATFNTPEYDYDTAKLIVKTQKTKMTTMLGVHYLRKVDSKNNFWWMEDILMMPGIKERFVDFMSVINLKVDLWNGQEWVEQGEIKAGLDLLEEFLIPIDLSQLESNQEQVKVRFRSGAGLFTIHEVTVDFSDDLIGQVHELTPIAASLNDDVDVLENITNFDDNKHVKMIQGDRVNLTYDALSLPPDMERGFIVALKGYYYMDADTIEKNEVFNFNSKRGNGIDIGIDQLKSINWLLELLDDVYKKDLEYKVDQIIGNQLNELRYLND